MMAQSKRRLRRSIALRIGGCQRKGLLSVRIERSEQAGPANGENVDGLPPNGLPFSCRERAADHLQKANDLARAAVGWNGGLGRRDSCSRNLLWLCLKNTKLRWCGMERQQLEIRSTQEPLKIRASPDACAKDDQQE